jgi:hypothetical protein
MIAVMARRAMWARTAGVPAIVRRDSGKERVPTAETQACARERSLRCHLSMSHLARFSDRFPDVPAEVMLKVDMLRLGVRIEAGVGNRHYHHHDERGQKPQADARAHLQGSVRLPDGSQVFITHNPNSPYVLRPIPDSNRLRLRYGHRFDGVEEPIAEVEGGPRFRWTSGRTSKGTPLATLFTPSLGGACGPLAVFLLRHCEFAASAEECRFCSWVAMGKSREMRPDAGDLGEALAAIREEQRSVGYLAFSGGSLFDRTKEAEAFLGYMRALRETDVPLPVTVAAIQALDRPDSVRLRDAGFAYACYSMEVWPEAAWPEILPGKARSVGRQRWMDCLEDAVDVFGPGRVLCNFVAGVETAVEGLFRTPEEAADSTLEGMQWCDEHGIYPKYAIWISGGGARFADRPPAPLDYYARLITGRQQLFAGSTIAVPSTDCAHCLTQSCEADLARLDPARFAIGQAGLYGWDAAHAAAAVSTES